MHRLAAALLACTWFSSCGGGDWPAEAVTFSVRLKGLPASEEFRVSSTSPQFIAQARTQLLLPVSERRLFVAGSLGSGSGGDNPGWSWHLQGAVLTESAIALCDGRPSMVQANLNYWVNTVKSLCPWTSYIHAEVP